MTLMIIPQDYDIDENNDDDDGDGDAHPFHLLLNRGHGERGLDNLGGLHASSECHHIETSKDWEKRLPETIIIKPSPENPLVDFQNNFKFLHVPRNFLETKKQFDVSLISLHKVHPKSPQKGPSKLRFGLRSDKTKIENETYNWYQSNYNLEKEGGREAGGILSVEFDSPGLPPADPEFEFWIKAEGLKLPLGGFGDVGEGVGGVRRSGCK